MKSTSNSLLDFTCFYETIIVKNIVRYTLFIIIIIIIIIIKYVCFSTFFLVLAFAMPFIRKDEKNITHILARIKIYIIIKWINVFFFTMYTDLPENPDRLLPPRETFWTQESGNQNVYMCLKYPSKYGMTLWPIFSTACFTIPYRFPLHNTKLFVTILFECFLCSNTAIFCTE